MFCFVVFIKAFWRLMILFHILVGRICEIIILCGIDKKDRYLRQAHFILYLFFSHNEVGIFLLHKAKNFGKMHLLRQIDPSSSLLRPSTLRQKSKNVRFIIRCFYKNKHKYRICILYLPAHIIFICSGGENEQYTMQTQKYLSKMQLNVAFMLWLITRE